MNGVNSVRPWVDSVRPWVDSVERTKTSWTLISSQAMICDIGGIITDNFEITIARAGGPLDLLEKIWHFLAKDSLMELRQHLNFLCVDSNFVFIKY